MRLIPYSLMLLMLTNRVDVLRLVSGLLIRANVVRGLLSIRLEVLVLMLRVM